jgi:protein-S-isoprenylcysteine O-methyltransferase Ste14
MSLLDHALYGLAWLSFGALHSILAVDWGQKILTRVFGPATRLAYNLIAVVHLGAVWGFGRFLGSGVVRFDLPAGLPVAQMLLAIGGLALLILALREFDLGRFGGSWQLRHRAPPGAEGEHEDLVTGGLHRYVRHPLYTAGFMILWGLVRDPVSLATAVWGSLYLVVGTRFEERKLRRLYGKAYDDYSKRVPPFIPWPKL